jgi:hypothetical protein
VRGLKACFLRLAVDVTGQRFPSEAAETAKMSSAPEAESPSGPAKLTDIAPRGKALAKPARRKCGDLTSDAIDTIEESGLTRQNASAPRTPMLSSSIVAVPHGQSTALDFEPPPTVLSRSDMFSFDNVGLSGRQTASSINDVFDQVSYGPAVPILFGDADCSDSASSSSDDDVTPHVPSNINTSAATKSASGVTEWSLVEQPQSVRSPSVLEVEVLPALAAASANYVTVNTPGNVGDAYHAMDSATLPQIIAMALGALLIIAGVAIMVAVLWRGPMVLNVTRMDSFGAEVLMGDGWFGLAFILVGATLEVIGLRSRGIG